MAKKQVAESETSEVSQGSENAKESILIDKYSPSGCETVRSMLHLSTDPGSPDEKTVVPSDSPSEASQEDDKVNEPTKKKAPAKKKKAKKAKKTKKKKELSKSDKLRKALIKEHGAEILIKPEEYDKGAIPTGSRMLDLSLGEQRGWPRGRVAEVYGLEQTAKTTLCLHTMKEAQAMDLDIAFVDLEKFDPPYASNIGVDVDKLFILRPNESSQILDTVITAVRNGADLVIVDSVAALAPKKEKEQSIEKDTVGIVAKQMNKALRNLLDITFEKSAVVLFINQLRSDIGLFSAGYVTTGGLGLRAFGSTRIAMKRALAIREKREVIYDELMDENVTKITRRKTDATNWYKMPEVGSGVKAHVFKNKVGVPKKVVELDVLFGVGIDQELDTFKLGVHFGIIKTAGSWFGYPGVEVQDGKGKTTMLKLQDQFDMVDSIIEYGKWDEFKREVDEAWMNTGTARL